MVKAPVENVSAETGKNPRVTVIISTYNWSDVLPTSVGSAARQTFREFEILVVGDACTDDSEEVMARLIAEYPECQIRWINCAQNSGSQAGPNNEGLRQARGEYIAYLGHDDLWLSHHLEVLVAALDAGADVAHSVVAWVDLEGNAMQPKGISGTTTTSATMHRVAVSRQLNGWGTFQDIEFPVDFDFFRRARAAGFQFSWVPRLSVVKIAAGHRRDIYKTRGNREQALWFERIQSEPDFETVELCKMLRISTDQQYLIPKRLWLYATAHLGRHVIKRLRHRLLVLRYGRNGIYSRDSRKFRGLS